MRGELPKKLGRGSPTSIPAVMLARLALGVGLHGEGLRGELVWDALTRARAASDIAAARLVVVDAISAEAAGFYQHHGFTPIPDNPNRLVQKMSDIASALDTRTELPIRDVPFGALRGPARSRSRFGDRGGQDLITRI